MTKNNHYHYLSPLYDMPVARSQRPDCSVSTTAMCGWRRLRRQCDRTLTNAVPERHAVPSRSRARSSSSALFERLSFAPRPCAGERAAIIISISGSGQRASDCSKQIGSALLGGHNAGGQMASRALPSSLTVLFQLRSSQPATCSRRSSLMGVGSIVAEGQASQLGDLRAGRHANCVRRRSQSLYPSTS